MVRVVVETRATFVADTTRAGGAARNAGFTLILFPDVKPWQALVADQFVLFLFTDLAVFKFFGAEDAQPLNCRVSRKASCAEVRARTFNAGCLACLALAVFIQVEPWRALGAGCDRAAELAVGSTWSAGALGEVKPLNAVGASCGALTE